MDSACVHHHSYKPRPFDLSSDDDKQELKTWCKLHWLHLLCKSILGSNAPWYHDCCIGFSRRGFVKRFSHPHLQSASVLKIPSLRKVSSPEELYDWLIERMIMHRRLGKKLYFPSINVAHHSPEDEEDTTEEAKEPESFLTKREAQMSQDDNSIFKELEHLREDNKRLLSSSKAWHRKYHELLSKIEEDTASYAQITPQKVIKQVQTEGDDASNNFLIF